MHALNNMDFSIDSSLHPDVIQQLEELKIEFDVSPQEPIESITNVLSTGRRTYDKRLCETQRKNTCFATVFQSPALPRGDLRNR